jgi:hypothetical protein
LMFELRREEMYFPVESQDGEVSIDFRKVLPFLQQKKMSTSTCGCPFSFNLIIIQALARLDLL